MRNGAAKKSRQNVTAESHGSGPLAGDLAFGPLPLRACRPPPGRV